MERRVSEKRKNDDRRRRSRDVSGTEKPPGRQLGRGGKLILYSGKTVLKRKKRAETTWAVSQTHPPRGERLKYAIEREKIGVS